jgi:Ca2+:H+ antiporter
MEYAYHALPWQLSEPLLMFHLGSVAAACCACRYLCSSIEEFSTSTGLSQAFLGMIVLPIAGNACEHITGG